MTITDAIPRLVALDGLELPDSRSFHVVHVGFGDGLIGHLMPEQCPAGLSPMHGSCGAFAFLLMDMVEAAFPTYELHLYINKTDTGMEYRYWWGGTWFPTRIEAVLDVAVPLMENYAKSKEAS